VSGPSPASSSNAPAGFGAKISILILFGAVLALVAASVVMLQQINQVRAEMERMRKDADQERREVARTRDQLRAEILGVHDTSAASTEAYQSTVELLKQQIEAARKQARALAGESQAKANKHADELAAQLARVQQEQAQTVSAAVNDAVSQVNQVKSDSDATSKKVGDVSSEVGVVKSQISTTKSDLQKVIETLQRARGDLDGQSALIARNARELEALKAQGERMITDLALPKEKAPRKFDGFQLRLTATDPKKNTFTVEIVADDKRIEKKDRTINEPLQFRLSRSTIPWELVVNDVQKDKISGYVSAPKAQPSRN
jgi:chromosome segregation ATPase